MSCQVDRVGKVYKALLTACLISLSIFSFGQGKEFIKKNFKDNVKGFKHAMDSIIKGDFYYNQGIHYYRYAIPYYMSAENFNPENAMLNYKIGRCMLYSSVKSRAAIYLGKALRLFPLINADVYYYLGRANQLAMNWDTAKIDYNIYLQTLTPDKVAQIADVQKKMQECDNGKQLCQVPVHAYIDNLGATINTKYPEYRPLISADETKLIFTSRMPTPNGDNIDSYDGESFEKVFATTYKDGTWSPSVNLGAPVNTKSHDATAGLSPDGQTLYIYRTHGNGDIYWSHYTNSIWTDPVRMSDSINSFGKEASITVSTDGKIFYFISDRLGGYGMGDIYKVTTDSLGNFGSPQNLGPTVNTPYDEEGVFLQSDNKTLYFSSTGHNTMGGYDIFKTVYENGTWSTPENPGYPINTPYDDVFYVAPANKKHAYFSSDRNGSTGDMDIYMITYRTAEKPVVLSNAPPSLAGITSNMADVMTSGTTAINIVLRGIVVDSETHKPLLASIELVDNKKNQVLANLTTDSVSGNYVVSLLSGINYGISVKADNYLFYSANINLTDSNHIREIVKNIALQPLEIGSHIALRNIFFDFDRYTLRKESKPELQLVIDLLTKYPSLTVEISGYTDSKGTKAYNLNLSTQRAKSVVDYLVAHGIKANRLVSKGYGMDNPVASNATDAGRQLNRRTEFKITGK
jgi:outer membrane protein OmpA-like peptidoglycan-associated protein/tetratricopeptide (TPR) repeat protein